MLRAAIIVADLKNKPNINDLFIRYKSQQDIDMGILTL